MAPEKMPLTAAAPRSIAPGEGSKFFVVVPGSGRRLRGYQAICGARKLVVSRVSEDMEDRNGRRVAPFRSCVLGIDGERATRLMATPDAVPEHTTFLFTITELERKAVHPQVPDVFEMVLEFEGGEHAHATLRFHPSGASSTLVSFALIYFASAVHARS